jgi:hypothetical protein
MATVWKGVGKYIKRKPAADGLTVGSVATGAGRY